MRRESGAFRVIVYLLLAAATGGICLVCVSAGSVRVPLWETASILGNALLNGFPPAPTATQSILLTVRLPRVLNVALTGASLSLCGGAMQGLLRNPLADGSTLGVASGASLGAVVAIVFGVTLPGLPFAGTAILATLFAFLSLLLILALAYRLDGALSTNTIILVGVVYAMFASSLTSFLITMAPDKVRHITFWTMGSLAGSTYYDALALFAAFALFGGILLLRARELNAFAVGEDNARHVGVSVRRVKLTVLFAVSALTGVCVSVGGTIGFVGLVTPHMARMLVGPNHKRLLPVSAFSGAAFLMLSDLLARVLLRPRELPIGVVTSFVGALLFVYILWGARRRGHA